MYNSPILPLVTPCVSPLRRRRRRRRCLRWWAPKTVPEPFSGLEWGSDFWTVCAGGHFATADVQQVLEQLFGRLGGGLRHGCETHLTGEGERWGRGMRVVEREARERHGCETHLNVCTPHTDID